MCNFCVHFIFVCFYCHFVKSNEFEEPRSLERTSRTCLNRPYSAFEPFYRKSIFESPHNWIFLLLLGILFLLICLGCLKGLLGILCSKQIGEFGMNMLIDLPKPLDSYRESELKFRTVRYDVVGWPVDPDTGERTVRILPVKTEFCLNLIFFLAYPLAIVLKLCALCCCIGEYHGEDDSCFREINVIKCNKQCKGPTVDMYKDNDTRETKDTNYVLNCMCESRRSLEALNKSMNQ